MKIKTVFKSSVIATAFVCFSTLVSAQPGGGGPDPDPGPGTGVPLDGGLSILIAAGIGYAAKKGYDKRKKERVTLEK